MTQDASENPRSDYTLWLRFSADETRRRASVVPGEDIEMHGPLPGLGQDGRSFLIREGLSREMAAFLCGALNRGLISMGFTEEQDFEGDNAGGYGEGRLQ